MKIVKGIKHYEDMAEANSEKHSIGEVWFVKHPFLSGYNWYLQFATARNAYTTKASAMNWSKVIKPAK